MKIEDIANDPPLKKVNYNDSISDNNSVHKHMKRGQREVTKKGGYKNTKRGGGGGYKNTKRGGGYKNTKRAGGGRVQKGVEGEGTKRGGGGGYKNTKRGGGGRIKKHMKRDGGGRIQKHMKRGQSWYQKKRSTKNIG